MSSVHLWMEGPPMSRTRDILCCSVMLSPTKSRWRARRCWRSSRHMWARSKAFKAQPGSYGVHKYWLYGRYWGGVWGLGGAEEDAGARELVSFWFFLLAGVALPEGNAALV